MGNSKLFTDSEVSEPLPPIYKGREVKIWPGQLQQYPTAGVVNNKARFNTPRKSGLRRYVFRYEGDKFVYLATRKGQRNGGFTKKGAGNTLKIALSPIGAGSGFETTFTFRGKNQAQEDIWSTGALNQFRYDSINSRWVWETAPAPGPGQPIPALSASAFSAPTTNTLPNAGTINEVSWTYISNPYTTQTPQVPANVIMTSVQWYNNNDTENLNKWPIKNKDMNFGNRKHHYYHRWQELDYDFISSVRFDNWDAGNGLYIRTDKNSNYFYKVLSANRGEGMTFSTEDYLWWTGSQWELFNNSEQAGTVTYNTAFDMSGVGGGWADIGYGLGTAAKVYSPKATERPDCLTDDFLKKCFAGVNLKHYDTVFVEVMWKFVCNKNYKRNIDYFNPDRWGSRGILNFGIPLNEISDMEWWSPRPYRTKDNKGRVYRIGILEEDTGVGGYNKVLWCQRTKIITTKYERGGYTALE